MLFFSERQKYFEEKHYSLFELLLGASYMQKTSQFEFFNLRCFCFILFEFVGICSSILVYSKMAERSPFFISEFDNQDKIHL